MKISPTGQKLILMNRMQCMRDVADYLSERLDNIITRRAICCGYTPSSSSQSSSSSVQPDPTSSSSSSSALALCSTTIDSGGQGTSVRLISLGSDIGEVVLTYDSYSVPDKFVVEYDGAAVIDTGYVGDSSYDSDIFNATGEHVVGLGSGSASFNKSTSSPTFAKVTVYAPLNGTGWTYSLGCPAEGSLILTEDSLIEINEDDSTFPILE